MQSFEKYEVSCSIYRDVYNKDLKIFNKALKMFVKRVHKNNIHNCHNNFYKRTHIFSLGLKISNNFNTREDSKRRGQGCQTCW